MTTVINSPTAREESAVWGIALGLIALAVLAFLFFAYALPAWRAPATSPNSPSTINISIPTPLNAPTGSNPPPNSPTHTQSQ